MPHRTYKEGDDMELNQISNNSVFYGADGNFSAVAGEKVKVDIAGVKQLEAECPAGKKWINIIISMKIEEENV